MGTECKKHYAKLFWDNPALQKKAYDMTVSEFAEYIHAVKRQRLDIYKTILRKIIERGHITEAFYLFTPDELREGLNDMKLWSVIPEIRKYAWRKNLNEAETAERGYVTGRTNRA